MKQTFSKILLVLLITTSYTHCEKTALREIAEGITSGILKAQSSEDLGEGALCTPVAGRRTARDLYGCQYILCLFYLFGWFSMILNIFF